MKITFKYALSVFSLLIFSACVDNSFPSRSYIQTDANSASIATQDRTPVEVLVEAVHGGRVEPEFGKTRLVVPKAFISGKEQWNGRLDSLGHLQIEASLPGMQPWSVFGEELFARLSAEHKDLRNSDLQAFKTLYHNEFAQQWISITLAYGHCFGLSKAQPSYIAQWGKVDRTGSSEVFTKFNAGRPGISLRSWYVPNHQGPYPTYIECPDSGSPTARCKAISDIDALVAVEYYFPKLRLNSYQQIDEKVKMLVKSFIRKSTPSAEMPAACRQHIAG